MEGYANETIYFFTSNSLVINKFMDTIRIRRRKNKTDITKNVRSAILIERDTGQILYEKK